MSHRATTKFDGKVAIVIDPRALASEIVAAGGKAIGSIVDVTSEAAVANLVQETIAAYGAVDILVNNAALFGGLARKRFTEITSAEWERVITVNTRGVFECSKAVIEHMRERGSGPARWRVRSESTGSRSIASHRV